MTRDQYLTQRNPLKIYYFEYERKFDGKYYLHTGILEKLGWGYYRHYFEFDKGHIVWVAYPTVKEFISQYTNNKKVRKFHLFELDDCP